MCISWFAFCFCYYILFSNETYLQKLQKSPFKYFESECWLVAIETVVIIFMKVSFLFFHYFPVRKLMKMILYFFGTPHRVLLSSWSPFSLCEVLSSLAWPLTFYCALTHLRPPSLVQPILSSMFFLSRFIIPFNVHGLILKAYYIMHLQLVRKPHF